MTPADVLGDLLRGRQSCRAFRPDPLPRDLIAAALADAQRVPSWCNSQPWQVIACGPGETDRFRAALFAHAETARHASDIAFPAAYEGVYKARRSTCGWQLYDANKAPSQIQLTSDNANSYITFLTKAANTSGAIERARIDASGNLLVGTTDAGEITGPGLKLFTSTTSACYRVVLNTSISGVAGIVLYNTNATNNGYRFYVKSDGGIANYSGNNSNLSDER
ncbi:MAG: hypothetical protein EBT13_18110, partial [Rhodobacteraceae bacterium]|nr:hypothetical protein [Paracoccaceae bacterium]